MIFALHVGPAGQHAAWQCAVNAHAAWLGVAVRFCEHPLAEPGWSATVALLSNRAGGQDIRLEQGEHRLSVTTLAETPHGSAGLPAQADSIRVDLRLPGGRVTAEVPATTPEQFVYRCQDRSLWAANDLRLMLRLAGLELDESAVLSLFQYGAAPPPWTISRPIRRLPGGFRLDWSPSQAAPGIEPVFKLADAGQPPRSQPAPPERAGTSPDAPPGRGCHPPPHHPPPPAWGGTTPDSRPGLVVHPPPDRAVWATLGRALADLPAGSALLFSGGVDSSLIAAWLAEAGRRDVHLLHYSFGADTADTRAARAIAERLGMTLVQVDDQPAEWGGVLDELAVGYSFPFCDSSSLPTSLLARAACRLCAPGSAVIDGTGADGAFGLGPKVRSWQRLAAVPRLLRWPMAALYKWAGLWKTDSASRLERIGRIVRRSLAMPPIHAAVFWHNAMDGIAYDLPADGRRCVEQALADCVERFAQDRPAEDRAAWLDLVMVCAAQFAAKSFDPLRAGGLRPIYPFISPAMIDLSFRLPWSVKCRAGAPKALLKAMLAERIGPELVARPKQGFAPPMSRILADPAVQHFIHTVVLTPDNPLRGLFRAEVVREIADRAAAGRPLSDGACNLMWAVMFVSAWLRQRA